MSTVKSPLTTLILTVAHALKQIDICRIRWILTILLDPKVPYALKIVVMQYAKVLRDL